jgi:hypothetical protein
MKMQNNLREYDYDEYDEDEFGNDLKRRKKSNRHDHDRRRPIRNWTKAFEDHQSDYDEVDEFYGKA